MVWDRDYEEEEKRALHRNHQKRIEENKNYKVTPQFGPKILMRCGMKVFRSEYEMHLNICFERKGSCFV